MTVRCRTRRKIDRSSGHHRSPDGVGELEILIRPLELIASLSSSQIRSAPLPRLMAARHTLPGAAPWWLSNLAGLRGSTDAINREIVVVAQGVLDIERGACRRVGIGSASG
jgi:hypothetical protein